MILGHNWKLFSLQLLLHHLKITEVGEFRDKLKLVVFFKKVKVDKNQLY